MVVIGTEHVGQGIGFARYFQLVIDGFFGLQVAVCHHKERWPRAVELEILLFDVGYPIACGELVGQVEPGFGRVCQYGQCRKAALGVAYRTEIHVGSLHVLQQVGNVARVARLRIGIVGCAEEVVTQAQFKVQHGRKRGFV